MHLRAPGSGDVLEVSSPAAFANWHYGQSYAVNWKVQDIEEVSYPTTCSV